jgi:hypothetical protein
MLVRELPGSKFQCRRHAHKDYWPRKNHGGPQQQSRLSSTPVELRRRRAALAQGKRACGGTRTKAREVTSRALEIKLHFFALWLSTATKPF